MKKTTDQEPAAPRLKLNVRELKDLQAKHGIKNLLAPDAEDTARIVTLDFLTDAVSRGLAHLGEAAPDVEEMEVKDLLEMFKGFHSGKS